MTTGERISDWVSSLPGSGQDLPPCKGQKLSETTLASPSRIQPPRSPISQPHSILVGHSLGTGLSKTCRGAETLIHIPRDGENVRPPERQGNPPLTDHPGNSPSARPTLLSTAVEQAACGLSRCCPGLGRGRHSERGCLTLLWPPPGTTCSCESSQTAPRL